MPTYRAYGLTVEADVPIPDLPQEKTARDSAVQIRHAPLPNIQTPDTPRPRGVQREDGIYFAWPEVGTYRVDGPDCITCNPDPDVDRRYALQPILGVLFGTLLHLRGFCTLHASAVVMENETVGENPTLGRAAAFTGWKRQGKSTTAAAFRQASFSLLTDDVLALEGIPGAEPHARPSFPRLKLRPNAAQELGYDWEQLSSLGEPMSKRAWTGSEGFCTEARPLAGIFYLDEGESVSCERLDGQEGFQALLEQSYAPRFLGSDLTGNRHFEQCSDLARRVPIYRLQRPRRFSVLPQVIEVVREHLLARPVL